MNHYEVHVTITPDSDPGAWWALCQELDIKPLYIRLDKGVHIDQYMCAANFTGTSAEAIDYARNLTERVAEEFSVMRTKLEAPLYEYDPKVRPEYFESHLKLILSPEKASLVSLLSEDFLGLSRSIWGAPRGYEKWYLTERIQMKSLANPAMAAKVAQRQFLDTYNLYEPLVTQYEAEVVLWDSAPDTDAGWLTGR